MSEEKITGLEFLKDIPKTNDLVSAYGSVNLEQLNNVMKRLKKIPNYDELLKENNNLQQENKQLKEQLETILDFDYFKNECPLNIGFGDEIENKAQDVFYEDEYCKSCKDDYKACWLKYFKKLQELKEKYK